MFKGNYQQIIWPYSVSTIHLSKLLSGCDSHQSAFWSDYIEQIALVSCELKICWSPNIKEVKGKRGWVLWGWIPLLMLLQTVESSSGMCIIQSVLFV